MLNSDLINALTELQNIASVIGQVYREKAYRKVISELKKLPFAINDGNLNYVLNVYKIPGVGQGIKEKIVEFIRNGEIAEINELKSDPKVKAYRELSKVIGVGPATIEKWWLSGIRGLSDLHQAISQERIVLNNMQKYGLKFYDDLNERIPRDEVGSIADNIKALIIQIDPNAIITIAGSYRRGSATSGDIDILVSNRDQFIDDLLEQIHDKLRGDQNFVDVLSDGIERITFLYRSHVSGKVRQVDVLNIRYPSYWAALLYFTGSWEFNQAMRSYAKVKGYRLNQDGLYKYVGRSAKKLELIATESEEEIFKILGIKFVRPEDRNQPKITVLE